MKYAFHFSHNCHSGMMITEAVFPEQARKQFIEEWTNHLEAVRRSDSDSENEGEEETDHMYLYVMFGMYPTEFEKEVYVYNGGKCYPSMLDALQKGLIKEISQKVIYVSCDT